MEVKKFKIDLSLAQAMAQLLEEMIDVVSNEQFDQEDVEAGEFLDQFMPNSFVAEEEIIQAMLASGIIKKSTN